MSAEPSHSHALPVHTSPALRWSTDTGLTSAPQPLLAEAPLAVEIAYTRHGQPVQKVLAITMRTPGHDDELALGFLLAEGLIARPDHVLRLETLALTARGEPLATQRVHLAQPPAADLERLSRGILTSSACGLCGRRSFEGLPLGSLPSTGPTPLTSAGTVARLPDTLRQHQPFFAETGGAHGAALADASGALPLVREDVGRHNAVDKLLGAAFRSRLALADKLLVLSGRASFELVQKAAAAGVPVIIAVGAPSSLAVSLAHDAGITLVGFARDHRFNVYTHAGRLDLSSPKPSHPPRAEPPRG